MTPRPETIRLLVTNTDTGYTWPESFGSYESRSQRAWELQQRNQRAGRRIWEARR